jgi:murein DD-endopeptidase MepM/ murein hydrolase activator NlpD
MEIYRTKLDPSAVTSVDGSAGTTGTSTAASTCSTGALAASGGYALPLERSWYDQHPEWFTKPHHDYPAADIPVPIGTPVFAAAGGVVVSTTTSGSCGFGVVINGDHGAQYTYCHGLPGSHAVGSGDKVLPGQRLMSSASTGNSTGPHLHFGIRIDGQDRCPQPFLVAVADGHPLDPHGLPASGCSY